MPVLYRIKDWQDHFENNRTRELKHMDWVPIPNKHDGDGYTDLVEHVNGAAHFGAWVAMVEVASKCDPRGTLLRDGGRPHDSASLSRVTRLSQAVFDSVIPRLLLIGWLTSEVVAFSTVTEIPQEGAGIPQVDASSRARSERNGTERNGTEFFAADAAASADAGGKVEADAATTAKAKADTTPAKVKAKVKAAAKADAKPEHGEFVTYFCDRWKAMHGTAYAWKGGRDGEHAKWVLDQCQRDIGTAKAIVDAYLADDDKFVVKGVHNLGLLISGFDRYKVRALGARAPARPALTKTIVYDSEREATNAPR